MLDTGKALKIFPGNANGKELLLKPADHVASGGEGAVYRKDRQVFKLYFDPQKALMAGMEEKIRLLASLRHPDIIAPQAPVFDANGGFIGYAMAFCDGTPLVKTFTNTWRDQNGFGDRESAALVENMRCAVAEVHAMQALMVDGNETNYLFNGLRPKLIDVDSWQIGRFPATAIMTSIRDYASAGFSETSDWFAWAIVSFQVFTGTHPYKGTHPAFRRGDLEARMRANASVFDPQVTLSAAVRDLALIPPTLYAWYEGVFQHGERSAPPSVLAAPGQPRIKKMRVISAATGAMRHELLMTLPFDVLHVARNAVAYGKLDGRWQAFDLAQRRRLAIEDAEVAAIFASDAALVRCGAKFALVTSGAGAGPGSGQGSGQAQVGGRIVGGETDPVQSCPALRALPLNAQKVIGFGDGVYAITDSPERGLIELRLTPMGQATVIAVAKVWPLSSNATRFYNGVAIYDALGTPFAVIPCGGAVHTLNAGVLRDVAVVDAFARNDAFVVVSGIDKHSGQLNRYFLVTDGTRLVIQDQVPSDTADINLAINPRGIAVGVFDDDVVEVINTNAFVSKKVSGAGVATDTPLFMVNDMVCYADGNRVMRFSLS